MSLMDSVVSPPGFGQSVTDFWGWDAREARLRCPDEVDGDVNLNSTNYPDHGHPSPIREKSSW
jgi:hypothetical protein